MQKKKLFLSTGITSCIIVPTAVVFNLPLNSITNETQEYLPKMHYANTLNYEAYSSNLKLFDITLEKFKNAIDIANKDATNYKKSFDNSKGMKPTERYNFIKNAKEKALLSKAKLTELKKELEHNKDEIQLEKKTLKQKEIDTQQEKNKENILFLSKDLKIINQGDRKNSEIIKEITDLEEAKFQLWKLEEYTGVVLPETKKGTTIDEVILTNGSNGNINIKLKLFTKYATTPIEEINFTLKGKTDLEASKSKKQKKLETKQEKAERLTKEYNDQIDVYLKVKRDYDDNTNNSQDARLKNILERERNKLNKLREEKDVAKAELRKTIFYPLIESLLDSAWVVDQGQQTVSDIANSINSLSDMDDKINKIQEVFGVRFFKKNKSFNLNKITIASNIDGTIKIELQTSMDHIQKYDKTWTKIIKGKSNFELELNKAEQTYKKMEPKIQGLLNAANSIKLEKPKTKSNTKVKVPASKNNPKTKQKVNTKKVDDNTQRKPKLNDNNITKDSTKEVEKTSKDKKSNLGMIIGISIASIIVVGIIVGAVLWIKKRKKQ